MYDRMKITLTNTRGNDRLISMFERSWETLRRKRGWTPPAVDYVQ